MNQPSSHALPWKKGAIITLQAAFAIGALIFVFHDAARRRQVADALSHASLPWLAAGIVAYGLVEILGGLRWLLLLRVQGFHIPWRTATRIFLIGLFLTAFTPGLIGGDAARVFLVIRQAPDRKAQAFLAVAMDRLMGLIALIILAAFVVLFRYRWLAGTAATAGLESATLIILAGGTALLILSVFAARLPWLSTLSRRPTLGSPIRDIAATFAAYRTHRVRLLQALANTIAAHLAYYLTFFCAARALGAFAGIGTLTGMRDFFSIMPIVNTLTSLPISVAGIGVRETLFQVLLHDLCHTPPGIAAAIGSLGFTMRALWSLPGAILLLHYKSSLDPKPVNTI